MISNRVKKIVENLTLKEKAELCSGLDFWRTKGIERLNIPSMMVSDGPHGLRKQDDNADHLGIHDSIKAVCFPAACATACSFDKALLQKMGEALGSECVAENVGVLLGPAINIKRSPLCGRNFEYFSEDPYLAGELAVAFTNGVQSCGVGVSVKHFAANNQETRRMTVSAKMSERTLREIYLPAFEAVVKRANPRTVMCSYNKINGIYVAESHDLLTKILREEWGFSGFVVSDWFAVGDRIKALKAGLDLEMPGGDSFNDNLIIQAVLNGDLQESVLDRAVINILQVILVYAENKKVAEFDRASHHDLAAEIECDCAVLLKNNGILPLKSEQNALFIGEFAEKPRYQGGGSSHINAFKVDGALDFLAGHNVKYSMGFSAGGEEDLQLEQEAIESANCADIAVVFAGLPDVYESEGYDRRHMQLPENQNRIISKLIELGKRVVVVLHNGSPVEMPWIEGACAVLEMYLGGEGVGRACAKLLYGEANPCGRLAETFPIKLQDNPSYLNFPGNINEVCYDEGIFVGYRYYGSKGQDTLFPFGFGMSYTEFKYENMQVSRESIEEGEKLIVSVDIVNVGEMRGKEVVQLYVSDFTGEEVRPKFELKGFEKVDLQVGERKTVAFELDSRAFAYYKESITGWVCPNGKFKIWLGKSSADEVCSKEIMLNSKPRAAIVIDGNTTVEQLLRYPKAREVMQNLIKNFRNNDGDKIGKRDSAMMSAAYLQSPLRTVRLALKLSYNQYEELINKLKLSVSES